MNPIFTKTFFCFLLSIILLTPRFAFAQSTVNFDVDVTAGNYSILKVLPLSGNKVGVLMATPNYINIYLRVYNSSGTIVTNTEITSLITWPSTAKRYTEFNAIVTNNGNILITYTASDSDEKLTDNASFIIINDSGALQASGQVNTTDPGASLTRFIQLEKLSDGKIVIAFQRTDNHTYAFRIFNENGTAFSANDIVYAGPGTANSFGIDPVQFNCVGAFKNGNFLISFSFFESTLQGVLFDNSGNVILVDGSGSFNIDATVADEYTNYAIVRLANGNVAAFWRIDATSYFKIISSTGSTVQARQVIAGGNKLGNFIPDNTSGSEGFIVTEYTLQGDFFENPYISYSIKKYNQTGVLQSAASPQGYLIQPSYYFISGSSGGYAYMYSYYKTYNVSDGEYTLTSDKDIKGVTNGFSMSTLPVNLISYTVKLLSNQQAQLSWSTASESNNAYFVVEKSIDGRNFSSIGRIDASGNTNAISSYSFTDPEMIQQKSWYRLKQFDIDGKEKDLGIRFIKADGSRVSASVYPNPVKGNTITISAGDEPLPASYHLTDVQGRMMKAGTLRQAQEQLDVQKLPAGIYFLRIGANQIIKIKK